MKTGDTIQIRQHEMILPVDGEKQPIAADPPIYGANPTPIDFWLYARVQEVLEDGRVRVVVAHPGNREHGAEKIVSPTETDARGNVIHNVRTKAEVEALASATHHSNPQWNARLQQHFKIQAERLS